MSLYTYMTLDEAKRYSEAVTDRELLEMLARMNELDGRVWELREWPCSVGRLWWKRDRKAYELFYRCCDVEYQIINFAKPADRESALNYYVPRESVANFMIGYLNGRRERR